MHTVNPIFINGFLAIKKFKNLTGAEMKILNSLIFVLFFTPFLNAQNEFAKASYSDGKDTIHYRLLIPDNYDANLRYPLVVSLHGSGERGYDNEKQLVYIKDLFLDSLNRKKYPCFVFAPQCPPSPMKWSMTDRFIEPVSLPEEPSLPMKLVIQTINELQQKYSINEEKIYITGLSQGGCGVYDIIMRNPGLFAAAAPICGWGDTSKAATITHMPIWIFHGDSDNVVSVNHSRNMVYALKNAGGHPKYTEYPNVNHGSWLNAYKEPDFLEWMFSNNRRK
jgi:predicted peptidase